ncbi:NAD-dependent epimerase/dehydratase family protein [Staphylococcus arlettae]|uniref:NAD-dependent epimerase/dehydratase family protein n=1 Tax=Staphylococcus TaxID=1279 RepID=UPI00194E608D|nr:MULTISPECIES: NAD-dependent epimerase/dehydratase family protein [unclassified Staphylococcus]
MGVKILITGKRGYVGNKLESYLTSKDHIIERIDMKTNEWKMKSLKNYDVIIHLAALVHNNMPNAQMVDYMNVNYHLTKDLAEKAKNDGVQHFIFFSTMSVFGIDGSLISDVEINKNTPCNPDTMYGHSKLLAEETLQKLNSDIFRINIVRPPMIYGKNAPGNFQQLIKIAKFWPIYPNINNKRSVIYIENLTEHLNKLIKEQKSGITHPQNSEYMNTNEVLSAIRHTLKKKPNIIKIPIPRQLLKWFNGITVINKIYGNLTYTKDIDDSKEDYQNYVSFQSSMNKTLK